MFAHFGITCTRRALKFGAACLEMPGGLGVFVDCIGLRRGGWVCVWYFQLVFVS